MGASITFSPDPKVDTGTPADNVEVSTKPGGVMTATISTAPNTGTTAAPEPKAEDRPGWLPEKFKTPEELARAYSEAERKIAELAQAKPADKKADEPKAPEPQVSNDTLIRLTQVAQEVAGDKLQEIITWAASGLDDASKLAYEAALASGNEALYRMAINTVTERWRAEFPEEPSLLTGGERVSVSAVKPFGSAAELRRAMSDRRYEDDPAYRAEVAKRLSVSNF